MAIYNTLFSRIQKANSLVSVGLDPVLDKLPPHLKTDPEPFFTFCKEIVDATHGHVAAFKPNTAFFEAEGAHGIEQLYKLTLYIKEHYPDIFLIIDAKRGDIGSTNEGYVKFVFDYLKGDAVTLHPYLGKESLDPFLKRTDKAMLIMCKNSNPGSGEFQNKIVGERMLYEEVAYQVAHEWNANNNCMLVVGATYPEELATVKAIVGSMPILVPGIGTQGGDLEATLKAGLDTTQSNLLISASRSIIYASSGSDFAESAEKAAARLKEEINTYR